MLQPLTDDQVKALLNWFTRDDRLTCVYCGATYTWESAKGTTVWAGNQEIACTQCWHDHH